MKTILIATDFTPAAHNAALYGIELAAAFNARTILFNSYQLPITAADPALLMPPEQLHKMAVQELEAEARKLGAGRKVIDEVECILGSPVRSIIEASEKHHADLIITGMKNMKGLRKLFGSTVTGLTQNISVAFIIVPEEAVYHPPSRIALAHDRDLSSEQDMRMLDVFTQLCERFKSEAFLLKVVKNETEEALEMLNRPFRLNKLFGRLNIKNEYVIGTNIAQALNSYVDVHKIQLLAMLPHQRSMINRLLTSSITKQMIFSGTVPLLMLPVEMKSIEAIAESSNRSSL